MVLFGIILNNLMEVSSPRTKGEMARVNLEINSMEYFVRQSTLTGCWEIQIFLTSAVKEFSNPCQQPATDSLLIPKVRI